MAATFADTSVQSDGGVPKQGKSYVSGNYEQCQDVIAVGAGSSRSLLFVDAFSRHAGKINLGCTENSAHWWGQSPNSVVIQDFTGNGGFGDCAIIHDELRDNPQNSVPAYVVHGAIWTTYAGMNGPESWLGPPTSDEFFNGSYAQSNFRSGYITWDGSSYRGYGWPASDGRWRAEYHNGRNLNAYATFITNEDSPDHNWGTDTPGGGRWGVWADNFSVRWTKAVWFSSGRWRFHTSSDDGVRLYVDDQLLIDRWVSGGSQVYEAEIDLAEGNHVVRLEYFEDGGPAYVALSWQLLDTTPPIVYLTAPGTGSYFNSSVLATADAGDGQSGMAFVEFHFYFDGAWHAIVDLDGSNGWSASWDIFGVVDQGDAMVLAWAQDKAGNRQQSGAATGLVFDKTPPQSRVANQPTIQQATAFQVTWSGTDNLSSIVAYDVQYKSSLSGTWLDWQSNTTATGAIYSGGNGQSYCFRSRAHDRAGNVEPYPGGDGDTCTTISVPAPTATQTPTMTPTKTQTPTSSKTWTPTATLTRTQTPISSFTPTRTRTPSATATRTPTTTPTKTKEPVGTVTRTSTPTATVWHTATPTSTSTVVPVGATPTSTMTPIGDTPAGLRQIPGWSEGIFGDEQLIAATISLPVGQVQGAIAGQVWLSEKNALVAGHGYRNGAAFYSLTPGVNASYLIPLGGTGGIAVLLDSGRWALGSASVPMCPVPAGTIPSCPRTADDAARVFSRSLTAAAVWTRLGSGDDPMLCGWRLESTSPVLLDIPKGFRGDLLTGQLVGPKTVSGATIALLWQVEFPAAPTFAWKMFLSALFNDGR